MIAIALSFLMTVLGFCGLVQKDITSVRQDEIDDTSALIADAIKCVIDKQGINEGHVDALHALDEALTASRKMRLSASAGGNSKGPSQKILV